MPIIKFATSVKPHPRQQEMLDCKVRFIVATCGRRFGKTLGAMIKLAKAACENPNGENALYWWAAPTYRRSGKAYEIFERALRPIIREARKSDFTIVLVNGVRIEFVSLDKWQNLKGDGLDGVVIDEAARCPSRAWMECIRPALADKRGWALIISTPLGRNWFYYEFLNGWKNLDPQYKSFKFPSHDNPYLHKSELEHAKKSLPEDLYKQEILAEFLEEGAGVFKGLSLCRAQTGEVNTLRPVAPDEVCTVGLDLGKHQDYTVICNVARGYHRRLAVTHFERMTGMEWIVQQQAVTRALALHNFPCLWMDSSGPGDRMYEEFIRAGIRAEAFKYSSPTNREQLLKCLQLEIAAGRLMIPEYPLEVMQPLWTELENFEYKLTPGGKLTMGPPEGEHDDCVAGLALAVWGAIRNTAVSNLGAFSAENQRRIAQSNIVAQVKHELGLPESSSPFQVREAGWFNGGTDAFGAGSRGAKDFYSR